MLAAGDADPVLETDIVPEALVAADAELAERIDDRTDSAAEDAAADDTFLRRDKRGAEREGEDLEREHSYREHI